MNDRSILVFAVAFGVLAAAVARRIGGTGSAGQSGASDSQGGYVADYGDSWQTQEQAAEQNFGYGEAAPVEDEPAPSYEGVVSALYDYVEEGLMFVGFVNSTEKYREAISDPRNYPYVDRITAAEARQGIPAGLLLRLAYQESRFRDDIVSGRRLSSAGAVGLMQIVPKWHPNVDPYNWQASVDYAAGYLRQLYDQFKTWEYALKAYNTGPGNLRKILAGKMAEPLETQKYSREILADAGIQPRKVVA